MVGIGEIIASALVKEIIGRLTQPAIDEVALQWGFKDDVLKMAGKMKDLDAMMHDADDRLRRGGTEGEAVERWLTKLRSVSYDAGDMLDELAAIELTNKIQPKLKLFFSWNNQLYQRLTIPHKIKNLREKVDKIESDGRKTLKLVGHEPRVEESRNDGSFAASSDEDIQTGMVGRDKEKEDIINLLLRSEANEHISIVPIVGLGGIGKTTLAQSVFADKRVKVFHEKAWVHVSKEFNLKKIGIAILKSINSSINLDNCTLQFLHDNLRNELATGRYLIVLDDLWEEDWRKLDSLKYMLPHNCNGSRVIVTTRNQSVVDSLHTRFLADKICPVPLSDQINLDVLSPGDCWIIMRQRAFKPGDNQSYLLQKVGREIAEKKCGGLPLVANALGHVMSELRTIEAWQEIRDTQNDQADTLDHLMLSYNFMKLEFKMCFTYLASFPKGFVLANDRLIQQWISLGCIHARVNGQRCINYLLGMSFLKISSPFSVSSNPVQAKSPQQLTMHNLVHDLATKIMGNEFLVLDARVASITNRAKRRYCRYAQLINYQSQLKVFKYLPRKVRSLHFRDSEKLPLPMKAFSRSRYIRVLDLSGCSVEGESTPKDIVLPSSICQLKMLRYLDATGLPITSLPKSFHTLQNMQSLILSNYLLETFPESICSLHQLSYLDLSGSSNLSSLPTSLKEISELSFLNLSRCSKLQQLPESICTLTCLQHLDMSKCCVLQHLPNNFGSLQNLLFLNLSGCSKVRKLPDSFNLESLEHMDLSSCHELDDLPQDFGNLQNLVFLNLSDCYKVSVLPESFCQLVHLKDLNLSDCHDLRELPECFGKLSELDSLNLTSCSKLQVLPDSFHMLSKLRHLNLSYCVTLLKLPSLLGHLKLELLDISGASFHDLPDSIRGMTTLTQLVVSAARSEVLDKAHDIRKHLNLLGTVVHPVHQIEHKGCSSNIEELAQLTCQELQVFQLENVRHEDLERSKLRDKSDLRTLYLCWGLQREEDIYVPERLVLERLVPPPTLEHFTLDGSMSKDFPNWMSHISTYLPCLTFLGLYNLGTCDNLPPFGQLPNLRSLAMVNIPNITKIGKEFYGEGGTCRKLRHILLDSMENLVEWWTTQSGEENEEFLIPNLHGLEIIGCPKLKFLPYPPSSMIWHLFNSSMVLPEEGFGKLSSSALPFLMLVKSCNFTPDKWDRLQHLPTLELLQVDSCNGLRAFPVAIRCLTSLTKLRLWTLKDLELLPEWLGNLTSLEYFSIVDCPLVISLPESMKNLTALRELWLKACTGLEVLPEWLEHLISLQELNIIYCPNLTCLPVSMKRLTALRLLWLGQCEGLDVLPEWLGQLISLQEFCIVDCPNLTRFPESTRSLTALKKLQIRGCPSLVERCQGEDADLISHIPEVLLQGKTRELWWTSGDAEASTSGDAGASTSEDAGPSTS